MRQLRVVITQPIALGPVENLLHDRRLRVRVVLDVLPLLRGELALRALVQLTVGVIRSQPIAEDEHALDLLAARGEHVQVHGRILSSQQPVLVPVRLAHAQDVADSLQLGHVRTLVGGVGDNEVDVDQRLRREPGHRGRADVVELQDRITQGGADLSLRPLEPERPLE